VQETFACARKATGHKGTRATGEIIFIINISTAEPCSALITMTMVEVSSGARKATGEIYILHCTFFNIKNTKVI
jgi:hypothetical protein